MLAERINALAKLGAAVAPRRKHHYGRSLKVVAAHDVVNVSVLAVGLAHNLKLERVDEAVERIGVRTQRRRLREPRCALVGVLLRERLELAVEGAVADANVAVRAR